jgi:hypothetical protein
VAHPDPAVQKDAIDKIVVSYGETRDLTKTARAFGCSRRTLEKTIKAFPALGAAIADVRNRLGILGR